MRTAAAHQPSFSELKIALKFLLPEAEDIGVVSLAVQSNGKVEFNAYPGNWAGYGFA